MVKTVIVRPEVFLAFRWEGTNIEEFKKNFERYDFFVREDGRLSAKKIGTLNCYECDDEIICNNDIILKSISTGEIKTIPVEILAKEYVEIQEPPSEKKNDPEVK